LRRVGKDWAVEDRRAHEPVGAADVVGRGALGADAGEGLGVAAVVAPDHHHDVEAALREKPLDGVLAVCVAEQMVSKARNRSRSSASPWRSRIAWRSISWISRLSLMSIVVWLARPIRARSRAASNPGLSADARRVLTSSAATVPRMKPQTSSASSRSRTHRYRPPAWVRAWEAVAFVSSW